MRPVVMRLGAFFRRGRDERQLNEEIRTHLDQLADEYECRGLTRREARAAARRAFGGVEQIKDTYRDQRGWPVIDALLQDLRWAVRSLRRAPGTSAAAIAVLALGTGLTTVAMAVVYGVSLRPLPYADPQGLVLLFRHAPDTRPFLAPLFLWNSWQPRFQRVDFAGYATAEFTLRGAGDPRVVRAALVTERFFDVLGGAALRGRPTADPAVPTVVLSARLAATLRAGTGQPLPSSLRVGSQDYAVAAVMAEGVAFPAEADVWLPLRAAPSMQVFGSQPRMLSFVGRVKPGSTVEQARDDVQRVFDDVTHDEPRFGPIVSGTTLVPLLAPVLEPVRPVLMALTAAAVLVLLLVSANVASLLVVHAVRRGPEIAVRLALGAGRLRILRSLLMEGGLLVFAGSAGGVVLAYGGVQALQGFAPSLLPRLDAVAVDAPMLAATLVVAATVTVLCALAPALHLQQADLTTVFVQTRIGPRPRARRVTAALVVSQVAISIVLLAGAGLLTRTVVDLSHYDLGIRTDGALAIELMIGEATGQRAGARAPFVTELLSAVHGIPGVRAAAIGSGLPATGSFGMSVGFDTTDGGATRSRSMSLVAVTPEYFAALGIPLHVGRGFERQDGAGEGPVAVVSAAVGTDLFPGQDPIGRELPVTLQSTRPGRPTIVGVVGNVSPVPGVVAASTVYVPWEHLPAGDLHLVVRTDGDPASILPVIRQVIRRLDPAQPIGRTQTLDAALSRVLGPRRAYAALASSLALLALSIAVVGLAALLSRSVADRRRELAIRAALGAPPRHAVRLVLRDGLGLLLLGLLVGLPAGLAGAKGLAALLYGVGPADPWTYGAAAATVGLSVMAACYVPARSAARTDPSALMRVE